MPSAIPSPTSEEPAHLEIRSVLLLEDDAELAMHLKSQLEAGGFLVTTVNNGAEGLREVIAFDFDAIVCDMMMPKMPGDIFYVAVSRAKPQLCQRFVFITGYGSDERVAEFIERVRGVVLHKPISGEELVRTINLVTGRPTGE